MKKLLMSLVFIGMLVVSTVGSAHAVIISEVESNNTQATAQNVDGLFSTGANADIGPNPLTIPWVSIISDSGDSTYDWYSFTVANTGDTGVFDIDYGRNQGQSFDSVLRLYNNSGGTDIASNDDADTTLGAGGSIHVYDSYLKYLFSTPGSYAIKVSQYVDSGIPGDYTLQISLSNAQLNNKGNVVPEPATMMLLGSSLLGMLGFKKKKRI